MRNLAHRAINSPSFGCIVGKNQTLIGIISNLILHLIQFPVCHLPGRYLYGPSLSQAGCSRGNALTSQHPASIGKEEKTRKGGRTGERGKEKGEICILLRQWTLVANRSWLISQNYLLLLLKSYINQVDHSQLLLDSVYSPDSHARQFYKKKRTLTMVYDCPLEAKFKCCHHNYINYNLRNGQLCPTPVVSASRTAC